MSKHRFRYKRLSKDDAAVLMVEKGGSGKRDSRATSELSRPESDSYFPSFSPSSFAMSSATVSKMPRQAPME